jgi:hypothetical protein
VFATCNDSCVPNASVSVLAENLNIYLNHLISLIFAGPSQALSVRSRVLYY